MSSELLNVHNDLRSDAGSCWQFKSVFLSTTPFSHSEVSWKITATLLSLDKAKRRRRTAKRNFNQRAAFSGLDGKLSPEPNTRQKTFFFFLNIFSVSQAQQKQDIPSCLCYGCACECMCLCVPRPPPPVPLSFSSCVTVVSSRLFVWPTFSICSHHLAEGRKIPWFPLCVSVYKWWVWTLGVTPELGD